MKRLLLSLALFSVTTISYSQELQKQLTELITKNPSQLCLDQIFKTIGFNFEFGTFGNIAADTIFSKLCFSDPKLDPQAGGAVEISGTTSYKDSQGKLRISQDGGVTKFSIGVQLSESDFKLSELAAAFAPIDNLVTFSEVSFTISNTADPNALFGNQPLINGLNISGKANPQGFIKNVTDPLGLTSIDFTVKVPQGFTSFKDIKFDFHPNITPEGLCPGKALSALVSELNLNFAKDVIDKLQTSCFGEGTLLGIAMDEENDPVFYFSGKIINEDIGMIKVKKDKTGEIIYTVGFKLVGSYGFGDIDKALSPLDSIIKFSGPTLVYTNAEKDSVFDLNPETNTFDPETPGALSVTQGFSLYSRIDTQGAIKEITDPLGLSRTKLLLTIPKNASKLSDVKIKIQPTLAPGEKICPFKAVSTLLKDAGINLDFAGTLVDILDSICIGTDFGFIVEDDSSMNFYIDGTADKIGGRAMIKYRMPSDTAKDKSKGLSLGYKPALDFKFSQISQSLSFIDSLITKLGDVTIAIATADNLSVFDVDVPNGVIDPNLKGAVTKLVKGVTITANAQFGSILGDALKIAAAQNVQIKIFIPTTARKLDDIKIGIMTAAGAKEQKICLSNLLGPLVSGSLSDIGNTCITGKHLEIMPDMEKESLRIEYDGVLSIFGKTNVEGKLFMDIKAGIPTFALLVEIDGDLGLSSIASEFKPFELFSLKNPKLLIANTDSDLNLLGTGKTKKGFTILSDIDWGESISKLMNSIGLGSGITTQINIPLNPSNLAGFSFAIDKAIDESIADVVTFKTLHLGFQGSLTPTFDIAIDSIFNMPGSKNRTNSGDSGMEVTLKGSANTIGTVSLEVDIHRSDDLPAIDHPFGLPIKLTNPWVKVAFTEGELTDVGVAGKLELGQSKVDLTGEINLTDPTNSGLIGQNISLNLVDLYFFYKNFVPLLADLQLPNILTLNIAQISINPTPSDLTIHGQTIPPGIKLHGKVDISEINATGNIDINIDPKALVLSGSASLTPINLGGGIIKLVSADDPSKGPSLGLQLDLDTQKMWIDGYMNLAGILESKTKLDFDKTGFFLDTESLFAGMGAKLHVAIPLPKIENSDIIYTITDEKLINFIQNDLTSNVNSINDQATNLKNEANKSINDFKTQCGDIIGLSDICKGTLDATNQSLTLLDAIFEPLTKQVADITKGITSQVTSVFQFNHITASGNLQAIVHGGKLFTVELDFNLLGKNYVKTLSMPMPAPNETAAFAQNLAKEIYSFILPLFGQTFTQLQDLVSKIKNFIDTTSKLIDQTIETAKAAGTLVYQQGKMVLTLSTEAAQQFVNNINNFGNDIVNFSSQVTGNVSGVAKQVGNSIIQIASSVSSEVEETWHKILRGGGLEYNYSVKNSWKNPVNINIIGFAGNLQTAICQQFPNVAPGSTVEWKSKDCMPNGIYWTDQQGTSNTVYFSNSGMQFDWNWEISSTGKVIMAQNWSPNCVKN